MPALIFEKDKYNKIIKLAKEEWLLSTDGVVKALHYNKEDNQFVAKVQYKQGTDVKSETIRVSDDWVIDTFGKEVTNKLMDRGNHQEFMLPVNEDGSPIVLKLDDRKITRVKYHPPKFVHKTDKQGIDHVTNEVFGNGSWRGLLEDGTTVLPLQEELVTQQFGSQFVEECKRLGNRKFVDIPVGSCRSSLMTVFPQLRCEKAPSVKFMQGEVDSCVFSSLASAFHQTAIPDLVRVAFILHEQVQQACWRHSMPEGGQDHCY